MRVKGSIKALHSINPFLTTEMGILARNNSNNNSSSNNNNNYNNNNNNNNNHIAMGTFDLNLPGVFPFIRFLFSFSPLTFRLVNARSCQ